MTSPNPSRQSERERSLISIVDDDEPFRRAIARLMRTLGHSVAVFGSAEEFLNSDRVPETTCLITDVQMPGMSGIDLQGRLLAQGHCLPIIFITAYPAPNLQDWSIPSGALGFLS
jgi:FixJ family two-component response regulator